MTIICRTCKHPKKIEDFYKSKNKSGHDTECKTCSNLHHYERRRQRRLEQGLPVKFSTLEARKLLSDGKKHCPTCKQILAITEFSTMKVRGGIASHCKSCSNSWGKEYLNTVEGKRKKEDYYQKRKDKYIDRKLRKKYGISYDQYKEILKSQNSKCSICGKTPGENKKLLAVDHNHLTGKNRGLLCSSCNICIGFIEKNDLSTESIAEYLKSHA